MESLRPSALSIFPSLTSPVLSLLTNSLCRGSPQASGPNYSLLPRTCEMPVHYLPWR
ncbi:unnamed protein product [Leuciscus chuanchicus]